MHRRTKLGLVFGSAAVLVGFVSSVYPEPRISSLPFWALILLSISISFHLMLLPEESARLDSGPREPPNPVRDMEELVQNLKTSITPPTLAFLALAESPGIPEYHGGNVASVNPSWSRPSHEWYSRAEVLMSKGLLDRIGASEFATSKLGRLFVAVALTDPHYSEVALHIRHRAVAQ